MDSAQDNLNQEMELNSDLSEGQDASTDADNGGSEPQDSAGHENTNDPLYVQKRLKQQKRAHEREIRELHARIGDMQARMAPPSEDNSSSPYGAERDGSIDEQIHKAVSYALRHKDEEERKAKEARDAAHVHRQYGDLHKHLDNVSDKYDDFEDVVRGPDSQFTSHMRDAALFLPKTGAGSAGEVLYHLGKNPDKLKRIGSLHALEQASELVKLSHALNTASEGKGASPRPLGNIKSNPVINTNAVTDKTPVGSIRQRMRDGNFK